MAVDERLREELDQPFGDEPADRPVERWVADGHRALRRRRAVGALAACGVVAALGTAYALSAAGGEPDGSSIVAAEPTRSATQDPSSSEPPWEDDTPVRYLDGKLQVRDGVVVHERVRNPYGYAPPRTSDALDLTYEGRRTWLLAEQAHGGFGYSSTQPTPDGQGFRAWVEEQVRLQDGDPDSGWPTTMRLAPDGRVVPTAGTRVLQRTDDPRLGDGFAPAGATTGAAVVTAAGDEQSYFVVWRVVDGELDVITTPPRDVVGASFSELLTYARSQYASGEGLR